MINQKQINNQKLSKDIVGISTLRTLHFIFSAL